MALGITPAQAQRCLDAIDLEELYALGERDELNDPVIEGFIQYTGLLIAMLMLYRAQLQDPTTPDLIRESARANAKRAMV